ncbi:MAG: ribosome biogenesis GTP-binding protein YihA/YsxC [Gemmatimonadota bacterium]
MIIRSAEFVTSIADPGTPPPDAMPQVAFAGRSNVGKSSLINTLLGRTRNRIAKVSSTPGKTQTLNYFRVNDAFWLVDLPGYGFAKVSQAQRASWKRLIDGYLSGAFAPQGVVQLIDIRHDPTTEDRGMIERLAELELPTLVVLTKADKLGRERVRDAVTRTAASLGLDVDQVLPFSAKTGEGRETLLESIESLLEEEAP